MAHAITSLPKWAQQIIERQEKQIADLRNEVYRVAAALSAEEGVDTEPTGSTGLSYVALVNEFGLDLYRHIDARRGVSFDLGRPWGKCRMWVQTDRDGQKRLVISADDALHICPIATNRIEIL